MRSLHRKVFALFVGLALAVTAMASAGAQERELTVDGELSPSGVISGFKAPSSALAQTDPALLGRDDATPTAVMIKLDYDAVASYAGTVPGLAPTSPSITGRPLTGATAAERNYDRYIAGQEAEAVRQIERRVPETEFGSNHRVVYGGIAAVIPANRVADVLATPGVVAVQEDSLNQPLTDASPEFVNAPPLYEQLGSIANAGEGVIYGNLDTGVWPEHPSFADQGNLPAPPGPARECNFGDNPLTPANDPFGCNNKLIGGAAFLDTYLSDPGRAAAEPFHTTRDSNGHGTHTASTSAGNVLDSAPVLGVDRGPIHGLAPGAYVMEYKVCGIEGCYDSDSSAAVAQAIIDGVDVINFSISGGTDPYTDPVELSFLDAYAAGVFVSASAGNAGPGAGTANHLSGWVTTVAASTQTREFRSTLTVQSGGNTATFDGVSITAGAGPLPIVLSSAPPYNNPLCDAPAPPGLFDGKIVACQRGVVARVEKGFNVLQGGAEGMVLYNPTLADVETDNHWLPTVHLADGTDLVAFLNANPGATASFTAGAPADGQGDVMAAFSSRGPAGLFIKPDVTAPGVQILAGHTPFRESVLGGPPGEHFQAIAGTSMSSPHVAGAAILLRAVHATWTPGQIKSALMTTAIQDVVKEDLTTPADPFDMGSGRIDIGTAGSARLVLDETAQNFFALGGDELNAVHLNLPSINIPTLPGELSTTRTVTNVGTAPARYEVSTSTPAGTTISVLPRSFNLAPGHSKELEITISTEATSGQHFAQIDLTPRSGESGPAVHLPVAFVAGQGSVSLAQTCDPTSIPRRGTTDCEVIATNDGPEEATVDLNTSLSGELVVTEVTGADLTNPRRIQLHDVTLQGNDPGIPSVDPGALAGYIPLDAFGVVPDAIGDEDIINYNVPPFVYNGVTYTALGVDSNGYVIAGGGSSEDNNCCNLPAGPDPAPPNNMVAPFWTDLDGTGAPGIYATVLTDGIDSWIVIEHRVNVFGTTSEPSLPGVDRDQRQPGHHHGL